MATGGVGHLPKKTFPIVVSFALGDLALLHEVIVFKQRFYCSHKAQYEKAIPRSFRLIPDAA